MGGKMTFCAKKLSGWVVGAWAIPTFAFVLLLQDPLIADDRAGSSGHDTYISKCSICHAADGSGNSAMGKKLKLRDLRSPEVQKQSDAQLLAIIGKGKSPMPGYEKQLGQEKMREVVAYLRELAKKQ